MLLAAALALQVDRQKIWPRCHQDPEDLTAILRIAHCIRELGEDARVHTAIAAAAIAGAESGVRFIDKHHDRRKRREQVEDLLEIRLARAYPLLTEVLELDHVQTTILGKALGKKGLARADRPGEQYSHRRFFCQSLFDGMGYVAQKLLGL